MSNLDELSSAQFGLPPHLLGDVFPFHFILNPDLKIVQAGTVIQRLLSPTPFVHSKLLDHFEIARPKCNPQFEVLQQQTKSVVLLKCCHKDMQLKGQFVDMKPSRTLLFIGSPWLSEISQLKQLGISLKDFPLYDSVGDYLFLLQGTKTALADTQKLAEKLKHQTIQLQATTSRFSTLIESLQAGVLLEDEVGQILLVNPAFCKIFNLLTSPTSLQNLTGQQLAQECASNFRNSQYFLSQTDQLMDRKQLVVNEELALQDGGTLERDYIPIFDNHIYRGHLWLYRDISDRKKIQFQLEKAKELSEAANQAKSQFIASMSHELRTPLNAIIGFAQLMDRNPSLNTSAKEAVDIINRSGEHLLSLINNILEMSKIESGKIVYNETSFNLHKLLDTIQEMLKLKANGKGLQLLFHGVESIDPYIKTDEGKLRQVLINLIDNAIKFTDSGNVLLTVTQINANEPRQPDRQHSQPYTLLFQISDTGHGISKSDIKQLFQPFFQTDTGRKSNQGTGLGLSICHKFVQLLGGDITVSSVIDQGTCFTFSIQVSPAISTDLCQVISSKRVVRLAESSLPVRLLVVDDITENRQFLAQLLKPLGFEVQEAVNGQDAIALWEEWSPDLIWLDMKMPVVDGYETARHIKAQRKGQSTVIVALTASALEDERQGILDAGCDDWVYKPCREDVILSKLLQHLNVEFEYENDAVNTTCHADLAAPEVTRDVIARLMPESWIMALKSASRSGDDDRILALIEDIPDDQISIITTLKNWTNEFDFERIINLT